MKTMKTKTREKRIVTVSLETQAAYEKMLAVAGSHKLSVELNAVSYPLAVIIERNNEANQIRLDGADDCGMTVNSSLVFKFGDNGIVTEVSGGFTLPQPVITKLLNAAKKWHYLFLWDYHSRQVAIAESKQGA